MPNYFGTRIQQLEDIRSRIKHCDPKDVNLYDVRDTLGPIIADLQILASLRRPDSYKLTQLHDENAGVVRVEIVMEMDEGDAEDMVRRLWLGDDGG